MTNQLEIFPKFQLHLPDGDDREIRSVFTEQDKAGVWNICVKVSRGAEGVEVAKLAEELVGVYEIFNQFCDSMGKLSKRKLSK